MKYDSRMGIAYDTLFYSVFYFNFDRIKKDYQEHYGVTEKDFSFYYCTQQLFTYSFCFNDELCTTIHSVFDSGI